MVLDQNRLVGSFNFNGSNKIIVLGNNTLTANGFSGNSNFNYVQTNGTGKLKMNVPNNATVLFPVSNSSYNPVSITNKSGSSDDFSVKVLDEVYTNGLTGAVITTPRIKRTWDISKTYANGGNGIDFTFNWNPSEVYNVTSPMLNHYNGTDWDPWTGTTTFTANSMTYIGYTGTFSPFAISSAGNPLPVTLTQLSASCANEHVELNWQTASEQNSDVYVIERSENGIDWQAIDNVQAAGNSSQLIDYSYIDYDKLRGTLYYQLQQVDVDGKTTTYGPISTNCHEEGLEVSIFPNPTDGDYSILISSNRDEVFEMFVEMANGTQIQQSNVHVKEGSNLLNMHSNELESGIYFIRITNGTDTYLKKLIIH